MKTIQVKAIFLAGEITVSPVNNDPQYTKSLNQLDIFPIETSDADILETCDELMPVEIRTITLTF